MSQKIRKLTVSGTPYEMGYAHGQAYVDLIKPYAEDRIQLVCSGSWSGKPVSKAEVLALAEACLPDHAAYAPDLYAEWEGMSAATGLSMAELLVVGGFTDFVDTVHNAYKQKSAMTHAIDNCTAFIVPDGVANGAGYFGQTWDMHDTAEPFVILLDVQPAEGPSSLIFTTTGCLGQIGMNEHGVAVGINNLMGADGQIGVTWNFVVRKALQQTNAQDALQCLKDAKLAGAHNYLIFDKSGTGYNVEAMSTDMHITEVDAEPFVHTNHCLIPDMNALAQVRPPELQTSTVNRLNDGNALLEDRPINIDQLIAVTRDQNAICHPSDPVFHTLTCGAAIMQPKTGQMWAVWGLPSENEYQEFTV